MGEIGRFAKVAFTGIVPPLGEAGELKDVVLLAKTDVGAVEGLSAEEKELARIRCGSDDISEEVDIEEVVDVREGVCSLRVCVWITMQTIRLEVQVHVAIEENGLLSSTSSM